MKLSVEILDRIFGFLVLNNCDTLHDCSEDPVLYPIVERHLFHSLVVHFNHRWADPYSFTPDMLSKIVLDNPRILYHVRLLTIKKGTEVDGSFEEFAKTLVKFPSLEYVVLTGFESQDPASWPDVFRIALEDCLNLPTIEAVHLIGNDYPLSLFDCCKNIKKLCFLTSFGGGEGRDSFEIQPKQQSLTLCINSISLPFLTWIKLNIEGLQSLTCGLALSDGQKPLSEFLGVCSESLKELDIDLEQTDYESAYFPDKAGPKIPFFTMPRNLQQLTIRATVSLLPVAAETISLFISSVKHLVLDIKISLGATPVLSDIDFSPLIILGAASLSIPHIDLYVHTDILPTDVAHAQISSSLDKYEDIAKLIKDGVLVIHSEVTAPECA